MSDPVASKQWSCSSLDNGILRVSKEAKQEPQSDEEAELLREEQACWLVSVYKTPNSKPTLLPILFASVRNWNVNFRRLLHRQVCVDFRK